MRNRTGRFAEIGGRVLFGLMQMMMEAGSCCFSGGSHGGVVATAHCAEERMMLEQVELRSEHVQSGEVLEAGRQTGNGREGQI